MATYNYNIALGVIGLCLCFVFTNALNDCDLKLCPGPLHYYAELGCAPIFDNATSCCPTRYNCDVWKNLPEGKCLVNGHVYESKERLRPGEIGDSCMTCSCYGDRFACFGPQCASIQSSEPCRTVTTHMTCCQQFTICDDTPVSCTVDGKPYKIGEEFTPVEEPEKRCYCGEGYTGVNDERFCKWPKPSWCYNVIESIDKIRARCAPIYGKNKSPQVDCNESMRCQKNEDYVIKREGDSHDVSTSITPESEDKLCMLGELKMKIGEELNESADWKGSIKCTCEVPPVPTCHYSTVNPEYI